MPLSTRIPKISTMENIAITAFAIKNGINGYIGQLQTTGASSQQAFNIVSRMKAQIDRLAALKLTTGLDAAATTEGYSGTMTADIQTVITALQAAITWLLNNFPAYTDAGGTWVLAAHLNADGTTTQRQFTVADCAPWVPYLTAVSDAIVVQ